MSNNNNVSEIGSLKDSRLASHEATKGSFNKCLLLYSGGLDTSVMLKWIQEQYNSSVVCLTMDIGQTADNLEEIKQKAINWMLLHLRDFDFHGGTLKLVLEAFPCVKLACLAQ
jgi:tRNA(Ile)-lysidine synthase TilS/MesJ